MIPTLIPQTAIFGILESASNDSILKNNKVLINHILLTFKGCVRHIFASLFLMSKREHLWNKEECFLFHLESLFRSWDNQILTFQIYKCHDIIKYPSMKHETHFTE